MFVSSEGKKSVIADLILFVLSLYNNIMNIYFISEIDGQNKRKETNHGFLEQYF